MTSIMEQMEAANRNNQHLASDSVNLRPEDSTTHFISMKLDEASPIFSRQKVNFAPPHPITHLVVSNNVLVMAMANKVLLKILLGNESQKVNIDLNKSILQAKIYKLFIDPFGHHLLISLVPNDYDSISELIYINLKTNKPKSMNKFKGHIISSVAWNYEVNNENATGPILFGTTRGLIFETELVTGDDKIFSSNIKQYFKQVFDIGKGSEVSIDGIEFHKVPTTRKYFIIITTSTRMYQFQGYAGDERPMLQTIFNNYLNIPERFLELPSEVEYSQLAFYYTTKKNVFPKTFGWMTEPGIYCGQIDPYTAEQDTVTVECQLIHFPKQEGDNKKMVPKTFVFTEFHAMLVYLDRIRIVCLLNEQIILEDINDGLFGKLVSATSDPIKNTYWLFTDYAVFKYKVNREDRNVWRIYMEKEKFDLAKDHCRDNIINLETVNLRQAQYLFDNGNFEDSAIQFSQTQCSFEKIALKFIEMDQIHALKTFLEEKMKSIKSTDRTQLTMIIIWVLEIYLNQLGNLKEEGLQNQSKFKALHEEFLDFLRIKRVEECVSNNRTMVYELLATHGDKENLVHFAYLLEDYPRVIQYNIQNGNFRPALEILMRQKSPELFYQFCPTLVQAITAEVVDALIAQGRRLSPSSLIPSLILCTTDEGAKEVVRYLEFCISKLDNREQAIHNYLLSLYLKVYPNRVLPYLEGQGQDSGLICYDIKYALRICTEAGSDMTDACVHLYTVLGLYESAVDMALMIGVDLAKKCAEVPEEDTELKKKLWLKIARHVVEEKNDIKRAMEFLQHCPLVNIEDILPFFPNFVTIDHFKEAICESLTQYNDHINKLKLEMEEATKSADVIRKEIQQFRNRYTFVQTSDTCSICGYCLLSRPFHVFPCGHKFHSNCLGDEVLPHLSSTRRRRVADLKAQLAATPPRGDTVSVGSGVMSSRDHVRSELDDLVASECVFCGDIMVKSIDKPFFSDEEFEKLEKEWE